MKHRYFTVDDHDVLAQWWDSWGWPAIPLPMLPKTGIIVSNGGVDVAAGFLYKTDSCVCWVENYISSKTAPKELRLNSVDYLIERLMIEAKEQGFTIMMSSVQHEGLIKKLLAAGCEAQYETGMSNMVRIL